MEDTNARRDLRRRLETHIALKDASPGFHLSDEDFGMLVEALREDGEPDMKERITRLEKLVADLCGAMILDQKGLAGSWGNPSVIDEVTRIRDSLTSVDDPDRG